MNQMWSNGDFQNGRHGASGKYISMTTVTDKSAGEGSRRAVPRKTRHPVRRGDKWKETDREPAAYDS